MLEQDRWYTVKEIIDNGFTPYKSREFVVKLINDGKIKAMTTRTGDKPGQTRHRILGKEIQKYVKSLK